MTAVASRSTFAKRLKALREAAGVSQYKLAELSGLSKQALSQLEKGDREPSWETVQKLARGLGVTVLAFVAEEEPPPTSTPTPPAPRPRRGKKK